MKYVEVFNSIEGEGKRNGSPTTFIRLHGCNLNCSYCDTPYAKDISGWIEPEPTPQELGMLAYAKNSEIYSGVAQRLFTVTGGEPLLINGIHQLLCSLIDKKNAEKTSIEINIETNGSIDIATFLHYQEVFLTMDYKLPSSGHEQDMLIENVMTLRKQDVLKFVIGTQEDMEIAKRISKETKAKVYFSPVWGSIPPQEIVDFLIRNKMNNASINLQLHKMIWGVNTRGV